MPSSRSRSTFDQPHPGVRARAPHRAAAPRRASSKAEDGRSTRGTPHSTVVRSAFDDEADAFRNINTTDRLAAQPRRDAAALRPLHPTRSSARRRTRESQGPARRSPAPTTTIPNSMPVDRARALIRSFSRAGHGDRARRTSATRSAACSRPTSFRRLTVPGHDNSAMDGYAVRFADLVPDGETVLVRVGESFAGKPSACAIGAGRVRAHLHRRRHAAQAPTTVVMQERASEDDGPRARSPPAPSPRPDRTVASPAKT
mgnify:CR=1 FL=1